jgi:hypothetical protein
LFFHKVSTSRIEGVFSLFNVYVSVNVGENQKCWDSLREMVDGEELENILIAGDLNISLSQGEK